MTLPWVRIDTGLPQHPKILNLVGDSSPQRWRAAFGYVCGIAWSAAGATDGHIPRNALPGIHSTRSTAGLLVEHGLWEPTLDGWTIHNYAIRQELSVITETKRASRLRSAERAACARWHGPDCWGPKGCTRTEEEGRA
jgi:hypothetical protein